MEVYGTDEGQTEVKQGVLGCPGFFFFCLFLCCCFFPVELLSREILTMFGKHFPQLLSFFLTWHFQCFTCKSVLIGYKYQNSRDFLLCFFESIQFCIEKYVVFFNSSFVFVFYSRRLFFVWIQNLSPSVATCAGHPLCPSIWPQ